MQGLVGEELLSGKELGLRRRFGARGSRGAPSPVSVTEYIAARWVFFDAERFRAIRARRAIPAHMPTGQNSVQQNQEEVWGARCRHNSCREISGSGWDLKYVWCR